MNIGSIKKFSLELIFIMYSATNFGMQGNEVEWSRNSELSKDTKDTLELIFKYVLPNPEDVNTREEFIDYCKQYFTPIYKLLLIIQKNNNNPLYPLNTPYAKNVSFVNGLACGDLLYEAIKVVALLTNSLHEAIELSDAIKVWIFIKAGADVNRGKGVFCELGMKPLYSAVKKGNLIIVRLLVEAGAILCAQEKNGKTPFDLAREMGNQEIIDYFQEILDNQKRSWEPMIDCFQAIIENFEKLF